MIQPISNTPSAADAMKYLDQQYAKHTKAPKEKSNQSALAKATAGSSGKGGSALKGNIVLLLLAVVLVSMENTNKTMSTSANQLDMSRNQAKQVLIKGEDLANQPVPTNVTATNDGSAQLATSMIKATEFEAAGQKVMSTISMTSSSLTQSTQQVMAQYLSGLSAIQLFMKYATVR
ncbi:MAG: hypothetical protein H7A40_05720 [Chlamydiales bacterium]|nr:hypothetical protein [Chlamydiales bacterium]